MFVKNRAKKNTLYRGPYIDVSYQVSVDLGKRFQRRVILIRLQTWPQQAIPVSDWSIS
jgi:hypothetical protein